MVRFVASALTTLLLASLSLGVGANQEYQQWLAEQQKSYQQFLTEQQKAFSALLEQDWAEYQLDAAPPVFAPKPATQPVFEPPKPAASTPEPVDHLPEPLPPVVVKPIAKPPVATNTRSVEFRFHGLTAAFEVPKELTRTIGNRPTQERLAKWWRDNTQKDHDAFLSQLAQFRQHYHFNDWDHTQLLFALAGKIHTRQTDQVVFVWYLLDRAEVDVKLARQDNRWFLLYRSQQALVETPFLTNQGRRYYVYDRQDIGPKKLKTWDHGEVKTPRALNLVPDPQLALGDKWQSKTLNFRYQERKFQLDLPFNEYRVAHQASYPPFALREYLGQPMPKSMRDSVNQSLLAEFKSLTERQKWEFLLSVVQQSFDYKTDDDQFGQERYLRAEEMLRYPYSDCEDRTHFLAGLAKTLTDASVVALKYPNHVALAVHTKGMKTQKGDTLYKLGNRQYIIVDPTYLNAGPGQVMPDLARVAPEILVLN